MPARDAMQIPLRTAGSLLVLAALLWGCGSSQNAPDAAGAQAQHAALQKALKSAGPDSRNMVSAVADPNASHVPVQVKFELKGRPDVGQPVEVDIAVRPVSGTVDRITGVVEGDDGLDILDGNQIPAMDRPAEGVTVKHTVKVKAKRNGIFTMTTKLSVEAGGQNTPESFSIPLIVGQGMEGAANPGSPAAAQHVKTH
jgi:hypothetical protein